MASKKVGRQGSEKQEAAGWDQLTWDDVRAWAGSRDLEKGRSYKSRVSQLGITADGRLLAWVTGTRRYVTTARLMAKGKPVSECSCPLQIDGCKHGVAVVLAFLDVLSQKKSVPTALDNDPRWKNLREGAAEDSDDDFEEDESGDDGSTMDSGDDFEGDGDDDFGHVDERSANRIRRRQEPAERTPSKPKKSEAGLREFLQSKSADQLIDLLMGCAERDHEFRAVLREQQALLGGKITKLVQEARREIAGVTAEPASANSWDDDDSLPNYDGVQRRLRTLLDAGHADEVVELGRELLTRGLEQVGQAHDEGETCVRLAESLEVVFQAVVKSSLAPHQKLLYAIDAVLLDDYDIVHHANMVLDSDWPSADWSLVADELANRLRTFPTQMTEDSNRSYKRDRLSNWVIQALDSAGRGDEVLTLCESEARTNGSYERFVKRLLEAKRWDDAERWAREGIANTPGQLSGIIRHLKETLRDIATQRKDWPRVAAFAADAFFVRPDVESFEQLVKAAHRAKCRDHVETAARQFLETGVRPVAGTDAPSSSSPRSRSRKTSVARNKPKRPDLGDKSKVAESKLAEPTSQPWPLPNLELPEPRADRSERRWAAPSVSPRRHLNVLLELALKAKQPDEILHWFDKLSAPAAGHVGRFGDSFADRVATAVAPSHPERSLELWNKLIDTEIAATSPAHYEIAAGFLRKVRNLLTSLDRTPEWHTRLASLRETQRRKRRLIEILDGLAGRPIVSK